MKRLVAFLSSLVLVGWPLMALAAFSASENFDSYTNGDNINTKNGGSSWNGAWVVGSGTWTVTNGQSQSSPNSLTSGSFGTYVYRPITSATDGEIVFHMRRDTNTSKAWYVNLTSGTTYAGNNKVVCGMEIGNIVCYDNGTQRILVSGFTVNTWYKFDIAWTSSNTYTISINDGAAAGPYAFSFGGTGAVTYVQFYEGAGGTGTHNVWIDSIGPPSSPAAPSVGYSWFWWW